MEFAIVDVFSLKKTILFTVCVFFLLIIPLKGKNYIIKFLKVLLKL